MTRLSQMTEAVVAGHICLDVIPKFEGREGDTLIEPGKLINVGQVVTATGGSVANTGLALHRLGISTRLIGKVGSDLFGHAVLDIIRSHDPALVEHMIVGSDGTSYTVVISPPGVDRSFFHYPGANDTFDPVDVEVSSFGEARLLHFGYPPLMRRTYEDGGRGLADLMRRAKDAGLTTSLDMAYPDLNSEAARVDWVSFLERVLPHVDVFLPSLDEMLFMLHKTADADEDTDHAAVLSDSAARIIEMGSAAAVLKLGDQGLYLRTTDDAARLEAMVACAPADLSAWTQRELLTSCFDVDVVGTTGAGDCTIAGFLAGLLKGLPPADVMIGAVAAGAFNVESADANSGIPDWDRLQARVASGWARRAISLRLEDWTSRGEVLVGPHDPHRGPA